jgi:hypothetical protein
VTVNDIRLREIAFEHSENDDGEGRYDGEGSWGAAERIHLQRGELIKAARDLQSKLLHTSTALSTERAQKKEIGERLLAAESRLDAAEKRAAENFKRWSMDLGHEIAKGGMDYPTLMMKYQAEQRVRIEAERRLDGLRQSLNAILVRNQEARVSDADAMSEMHELFYEHFQRKVVEKQEIK